MLKPIPEPPIRHPEYISNSRLPAAPEGFYWTPAEERNWRYLRNNRTQTPLLWVVCENGRLLAGFINSGVGHWLSLTEEKEQIMQLLTKWRLTNEP